MKKEILKRAKSLLWKYTHILNEVIAQKKLYPSESEYWNAWLKFSIRVNLLQSIIIRNS